MSVDYGMFPDTWNRRVKDPYQIFDGLLVTFSVRVLHFVCVFVRASTNPLSQGTTCAGRDSHDSRGANHVPLLPLFFRSLYLRHAAPFRLERQAASASPAGRSYHP